MLNSTPPAITAVRYGISVGIISSAPVVIWLLLQNNTGSYASSWSLTLVEALHALWITQAMAITMVLPLYAWQHPWKNSLSQATALVFIPLPLYAIAFLSQAFTSMALLGGIGFLGALALLLIMISKGVEYLFAAPPLKALLRVTLQLSLTTLLWAYRDLWLTFITL